MRDQRTWAVIGLVVLGSATGNRAGMAADAGAASGVARTTADVRALAATVDRLLVEKWAEVRVAPVGPADDAEYLRRLSLDLVGKIPAAAEAREFLDDPTPDKRARLVERLLASPAYVARTTDLWRQLLLPEADTEPRARRAAPALEAWLRKQVVQEVGYDRIVRAILTARLGLRPANAPEPRGQSSPTAFYDAKEGKPENLAAATARAFLGVRLECAQCHNHPFARWKREEFWGLAACFAGIERQGPGDGPGAIREVVSRRELAIPGTDKVVKAAFLDAPTPTPTWIGQADPRAALADWVTAPANPFFARAAVNRTWARFFGTGLVDPVDDMGVENPPLHPELLDELARQFVAHDFDLKFLIRAITATRAYGLTSALDRPEPVPCFAAMPVRGLAAGQLYASLVEATGLRAGPGTSEGAAAGRQDQFLDLFAARDEKATEAQTTILQALALMNGPIVAEGTNLAAGDTLAAVAEAPYLTTAGRVEELYLAALTRPPRPDESTLLVAYIDAAGSPEARSRALADVFWAILNGPEFKHNH